MDYIQITESELDKILAGEELNKSVKTGEIFNGMRY